MTSDSAPAGPIVTGFAPSGFKLGDAVHRSVLLTVDAATPWSPPPLGELTVEALQPLIAARPEFILLGSGATMRRPPPALTRALDALGLGIEVMDSRAAARAWGVLRGEGRQVAAALYPLD
jgi:uncharacterized protein